MTLDTNTLFHILVLTTTVIKWYQCLEAVRRHQTIYQIQERCSNQSRFKIMSRLKKFRKAQSQNLCLDRPQILSLSQSKRLNRNLSRNLRRVNQWKNNLRLRKRKRRNNQSLSLLNNLNSQKQLKNKNQLLSRSHKKQTEDQQHNRKSISEELEIDQYISQNSKYHHRLLSILLLLPQAQTPNIRQELHQSPFLNQ